MIEEAKEANEWRGLPSRRLQPKRRKYKVNPGSVQDLALYFARAHAEVATIRWGDQGFGALRKVFSELKKEGTEPDRIKVMIDLFFMSWNPETSSKYAWQVFIGRKQALIVRTRDFKSPERIHEEQTKDIDAIMARARAQVGIKKP